MEELLKHILLRKSLREMPISLMAMMLWLFFSSVSISCYHKKTPSNFSIPDSIQETQISSRILKGRHYSPNLKKETNNSIDWAGTTTRLDSFAFRVKHHYSEGFNFVVNKDTLMLLRQQPEEIVNKLETDSFPVTKGKPLVVADIRILPNDTIDSVWVRVATEDSAFGWAREKQLLNAVDPDTPISQFISLFSNTHLLIFLVIISLIGLSYLMRKIMKRNANIVHFNDINSFYPTLLAIIVATSATFYASIQLFAPETWREFYFHPSFNPFSQPLLLNIFLLLVWAMLLVAIAVVDDVRRLLRTNDAFMYLSGLVAICAVDYIIFSVLTLYYIGYLLLLAYIYYAIHIWIKLSSDTYECGNCGARLHRKGRCPHCGVMNE